MNNVAYYHIHLTDDPCIWSSIFIEQMRYIEESKLINNLSVIRVRCITQDDARNQMFKNLTEHYNVPFNIEFIKSPFDNDIDTMHHRDTQHAFSEDITLERMWRDAVFEDNNILYFHTKGTTSFFKNLNPMSMQRHKEYYYWRQFMNWGVLTRWQDCVNALNTGKYDTAGCNFYNEPMPHYSGNFWWTKSSHIRRLPNPTKKGWWYELQAKKPETKDLAKRMSDEMWLCSVEDTMSYDIVNVPEDCRPLHDCLVKDDYERMLK